MDTPKRSYFRKIGNMAYRVFLPFAAIKKTGQLFRKDFRHLKGNLDYIGDTSKEITSKKNFKPMSFAQAVGTSEHVIRQHFEQILQQKQMYLLLGSLLIFLELLSPLLILDSINTKVIFFSICGALLTASLTFIAAMGKQLRLWQLRTRRLSIEEKGGFDSFVNENRDWWLQTLNLKIKYKP